MMITAHHIIGLTPLEQGGLSNPEKRAAIITAVTSRWERIRAEGMLLSRKEIGTTSASFEPGRSFLSDDLAQDDEYVFLTTGDRLICSPFPQAVFGWQFDAENLVRTCGALVCARDLGGDFAEIIYASCVEVAAGLPRLDPVSDEVLDAFLLSVNENDPEMKDYLREESRDPTNSLHALVSGSGTSDTIPDSAVMKTRSLALERIHALKEEERKAGDAAIALLHQGCSCEVLVPHRLAISLAINEIRGGTAYALSL